MKEIKASNITNYGGKVVIMDTEDLTGHDVDKRFDYLIIDTKHISAFPEWYILIDVRIRDVIHGLPKNRIGLNYGKIIRMNKKPTKKDIVKELI